MSWSDGFGASAGGSGDGGGGVGGEELAAPKTAAPLARLTRPGDSAGALWAHRLAVLVSARKAADATTRRPRRWAAAAAAVRPARGGPARASAAPRRPASRRSASRPWARCSASRPWGRGSRPWGQGSPARSWAAGPARRGPAARRGSAPLEPASKAGPAGGGRFRRSLGRPGRRRLGAANDRFPHGFRSDDRRRRCGPRRNRRRGLRRDGGRLGRARGIRG